MLLGSYVEKDVNEDYFYDEADILLVWQSYIIKELREVRFYCGEEVDGISEDGTLITLLKDISLAGRAGALLVTTDQKLYQCNGHAISICGAVNYEKNLQGGYNAITSNLKTVLNQIVQWYRLHQNTFIPLHKIIFPYRPYEGHWNLACLTLKLSNSTSINVEGAEIIAYDPFSSSTIRDLVINEIEQLLQNIFNRNASLTLQDNSNHKKQQYDGSSCGAITAENGKDFLKDGQERLKKEYPNDAAKDLRRRHLNEVNKPAFAEKQWHAQYSAKGDRAIANKAQIEESLTQLIKQLGAPEQRRIKKLFNALYNIKLKMEKDSGESLLKILSELKEKATTQKLDKNNTQGSSEKGRKNQSKSNKDQNENDLSGLIDNDRKVIEKYLPIPLRTISQIDSLCQDPTRVIFGILKEFVVIHKKSLSTVYDSILNASQGWQEGCRDFFEEFSSKYKNFKNENTESSEESNQMKICKLIYYPTLVSSFQNCGCFDPQHIKIENETIIIETQDEEAIINLRRRIIQELVGSEWDLGQWVKTHSDYQAVVKELTEGEIITQNHTHVLTLSQKTTNLLVESIEESNKRRVRARLHPPTQTGSAGTHLEEKVQAYFLTLMITKALDPILKRNDYHSIIFQAEPQGYKTDDLVITFGEEGQEEFSQLLCQVKRNLSYGFDKAISQAWEDFDRPRKFNPKRDYIVLITHEDFSLLKGLIKYAGCASNDLNHFRNNVKANGEKMEKIYNNIRKIIKTETGLDEYDSQINRKVFDFILRIRVLQFSDDIPSNILTRIVDYRQCSVDEAIKTWDSLCKIVANHNEAGGKISIDPEHLPDNYASLFSKVINEIDIDGWGEQNFPPVDNFVGRKSDLQRIREQLFREPALDFSKDRRLLALRGLGGVGKSDLALKFVHEALQYQANIKYRLFFDASTSQTLNDAYGQLAKELGIPLEQYKTNETRISKVKNWLTHQTGWIILFDNAPSEKNIINYLPRQGGYIIITTRSDSLKSYEIDINVMTTDDAKELLKSKLNIDTENDDNDLRLLIELLDRLPLALVQAAAYIRFQEIEVSQYIEQYNNRKKDMLDFDLDPLNQRIREYQTVYCTWDISLTAIENIKYATDILTFCAYLSPNNIKEALLLPLTDGANNNLARALLALSSLSLIKIKKDSVITIHRVLQDVIQEKQKESKEHKKWIEKAIKILDTQFEYDRNQPDSIHSVRYLVAHITHTLTLSEKANVNSEELASLLHKIGVYYLDIENQISLAKKYLQDAIVKNVNDRELKKKSYRQRFKCLERQGKSDEALKLLREEILPSSKADYLIENHCDCANLLMNANPKIKQPTINEFLRLTGPTYKHIRAPQKRIEYLHSAQGELDKALIKGKDALIKVKDALEKNKECSKEMVDEAERKVAMIHHYQGNCLYKLNEYDSALQKYEEAEKLKLKHYPENHFEIARTYHQIGLCFFRQKKFEESIKKLILALEIRRKFYNAEETLSTLLKLAQSYRKNESHENLKSALNILEERLAIQASLNHSKDDTLYLLGDTAIKLNERDKARYYYDRIDKKEKYQKFLSEINNKDIQSSLQPQLNKETELKKSSCHSQSQSNQSPLSNSSSFNGSTSATNSEAESTTTDSI